MKKILYINQYFKHPSEPGITRSYWIARQLIASGYDVTMLAHRNSMLEHVGDVRRVAVENIDGIRVIYLSNRYSNSMGVVARAWSFLSFMVRSSWHALREPDVGLVIATSTPLTVAFPALVRLGLRRTPFIFEVRDLWPEVPIQMGAVKHPWLMAFLRWFEKLTYVKAEHVVALSPGMREGVCRHIPQSRTSMIPNMAKIDKFWPRLVDEAMRKGLGLRASSFKVIYFGQMGLSNALPYIMEAVRLLHARNEDVEFIFAGHGRYKAKVEQQARDEDLRGVHVFGRFPMDQISALVNLCDVSLVTFTDLPILRTNSPNKLFDSLSAGKPVIVNSAGWTKTMVETHTCGIYVDPSQPSALVDAILLLRDDPVYRERLGVNARRLAEHTYDKSILCKRFVSVVDRVWDDVVPDDEEAKR